MRDSERDDIKKLRAELKSLRDTELRGVIAGINKIADLIKKGFKTMATKIEELNAKIDEVAEEIEKQLAVITAPGTSDADMDKATARLQTAVDRLKSDNPAA